MSIKLNHKTHTELSFNSHYGLDVKTYTAFAELKAEANVFSKACTRLLKRPLRAAGNGCSHKHFAHKCEHEINFKIKDNTKSANIMTTSRQWTGIKASPERMCTVNVSHIMDYTHKILS